MQALAGVTIADFSRVLAGPYATMLLADLGATVIKIERPGTGDDTRAWGPPFVDGESTYYLGLNRNKRSVALDLGSPEARELAAQADVVIENFRPGTMARHGLDYATLSAANPKLVYCSITGFGPDSSLPGYDLLVQAVGGLMSVTGTPGSPTKAGVALVDVITGLHAMSGILAALRHAERTGEGQLVEVSLLSSLLSALVNQSAGYVMADVVPTPMGNQHPSVAPYEVFEARDRPIVLAVGNDKQFAGLCEVLGIPDDPRFQTNALRVQHRPALTKEINSRLGSQDAAHWLPALTAVGVPCGPINNVAEAVTLAARLGLEPVIEIDGLPQVANPIRLAKTPAEYHTAPGKR
ncbi:crotonobetainyl-CoA:carnitine CoA-transferase CaiB-like acyl-CoA transferase [Kibdelosporangium banguiense]|uniref:Crotonobetainyl-CoA:carnitine CoA-transferase CaiB-like acyl-CoA transferase n=1 Tax=Kibdelosporangium banguiense TaxID=1365924 RepID=A0ABS4TG86_9PSEU|nr:CoA transferase [Kibdelosporangium banguiense]MBP2323004.1 crotonobetainyl-CoA:carnitine CoA-transferase CaiB-like acyl-CoA transferase [Kibdelosporangium banguiense]